jgi:hypothetical protein
VGTTSEDVATLLGTIARDLSAKQSVDDALQRIVTAAQESVEGADAVGISYLLAQDHVAARACTSELIDRIDAVQTEHRGGPCMEVLSEGPDLVGVDDFTADTRWPEVSRGIADLGVGSGRSYRLYVERETLGVLSLFSARANAFTTASDIFAELFTTHASIALAGVRRQANFDIALRHRDLIGQAKGFLIAKYGLNEQSAFDTLVRFSQRRHLKVYEVASELMASESLQPS